MTEDKICFEMEAIAEDFVGQDQKHYILTDFLEKKFGNDKVDLTVVDERTGSRNSHLICIEGVNEDEVRDAIVNDLEKKSDYVSALSKALRQI